MFRCRPACRKMYPTDRLPHLHACSWMDLLPFYYAKLLDTGQFFTHLQNNSHTSSSFMWCRNTERRTVRRDEQYMSCQGRTIIVHQALMPCIRIWCYFPFNEMHLLFSDFISNEWNAEWSRIPWIIDKSIICFMSVAWMTPSKVVCINYLCPNVRYCVNIMHCIECIVLQSLLNGIKYLCMTMTNERHFFLVGIAACSAADWQSRSDRWKLNGLLLFLITLVCCTNTFQLVKLNVFVNYKLQMNDGPKSADYWSLHGEFSRMPAFPWNPLNITILFLCQL